MQDLIVYSEGLCYMSVCTNLPREEVVAKVQDISPSGTTVGWQLAPDSNFSDKDGLGKPNPCPCDIYPNRTHYLLTC